MSAEGWPPRGRPSQTDAIRAEIDALIEQESYTRRLMSDYSRLVDENERAAIVRELTNVVGKHFDIRQEVRERELLRLEAQLRALRDLHQKRAKLRNEIVQERVRQLLRDLDGLGWGADGVELELRPEGGAPGPIGPRPMGMAMPGGSMPPGPAGMPSGGSGMGPLPPRATPRVPGDHPVADPGQGALDKSLDNLKQLALAMHNYQDTHRVFPPSVLLGPDGKTPHSWRVALLPYLGQNELYKQYKLNEPWDSENNLQLLDKMPAVFRDPDAQNGTVFSSYFQISGLTPEPNRNAGSGTFDPRFKPRDITDGTSNTLMLVEAKRNIPWTKPEDIPYLLDKLPKFGGHHSGVFLAAFYDGSARKLPLRISDATLRALVTPNGGEPINASALDEKPAPPALPASGGPTPTGNLLPAPPGAPGSGGAGASGGGGAPVVPGTPFPEIPSSDPQGS